MADEAMHMVEVVSNDFEMTNTNKMDCTILDYFTKLKNEIESERIHGGIALLKYLIQQNSEHSDSQEFKYAIKRLIRSLGSSKTTSRIGFYTTLTVYLIMNPETSIEQFLSIVNSELHPVNSNSKSENGDIYMGRILAYGTLIRSKILLNSTCEIQLQIIQDLINAGKQRSYLSIVSVSFLVEFVNQIDAECIKQSVWPVIEKEFGKPWTEQTLDSFYALLVIKNKCPSLVNEFSKKHFGTENIITKETMDDIVKVLLDLPRIISCHHPIFKFFCENLVSTELIIDFWTHIDQKFTKPSKTDEYLVVQILKFILSNTIDKSILPSLLSPNYVQHMLKKCTGSKYHNKDEVILGFKEVLNLLILATNSDDTKLKIQIAVLKKLILYPGDLMIEKKTGIKVIQMLTGNLNLDGIKKVSKIYRDIIENTIPRNKLNTKAESFWTNAERIYAAHLLTRLMGHPKTLVDKEWRLDQLKFLFTYGLCEMPNVGVDLAPQFKETFYHALDHKLPRLNDLRNILSELVHFLDIHLKKQTLKLRNPLGNEANNSWEKVMCLIKNLENNSRKTEAVPVFHTMNLHMGLQLFSDSQMAIMAIDELQSCYERLLKKSKKHKINSNKTQDDEPEWVEVVVDLLLSFYSKNSHLLRSLVGCVFPHICSYVTPTAIHQILAVLDVRDDKGPLITKNGFNNEEEENSSETESNSDSDNDDKINEENINNEVETSTDNDSDSNEESMNEDEDEDEDEDETVTDRLRMAVRQALGDASVQTDDEDINVDNIDEEEGKRLDESLAAAFRILRENRQSRSKKQEKSAQTLTHFRIRVIDLLETYLEYTPSMAIVLDMLLPLFTLLEYCIKDPHQKPLQDRVRSCLKILSMIKKFKDTENVDEELLTVILKALIEKGERTTSVYHEMSDKLAECCTFLVRCVQQANVSTDAIIKIYVENLTAFFKRRDCVLSPLLFKSILQLQWDGNWHLTPLLVDFAFDSTVRSFRRGYALEFLTIFYNNSRLVHSDKKHSDVRIKMEKKLYKNTISTFQGLSDMYKVENRQIVATDNNKIGKEVKQRYICLLFSLLRSIYTHHLPQAWNWNNIGNVLKTYRAHVSFAKDTKAAYNRLAAQIGIPLNISVKKATNKENTSVNGEIKEIANNVKQLNNTQENGNTQNDTDITPLKKNELKKRKKNKSKQKNKQLLKKEARMLREKTLLEGFEPCKFSSLVLHDQPDEDVSLQNGNFQTEQTSSISSQKRTIKSISDDNKVKRRKSMQTV
ncbi:PREDICTED: myb-binding protein 1A [Eufriesea mexicana]|uniref:myb-binding protein 1A n=1 Tax=Eufriesea mexicana TaxID=516756 RepID=UPI00083BA813|nr:PREDICTED: myb-binding protein 1A [Eufriesea mexicana]